VDQVSTGLLYIFSLVTHCRACQFMYKISKLLRRTPAYMYTTAMCPFIHSNRMESCQYTGGSDPPFFFFYFFFELKAERVGKVMLSIILTRQAAKSIMPGFWRRMCNVGTRGLTSLGTPKEGIGMLLYNTSRHQRITMYVIRQNTGLQRSQKQVIELQKGDIPIVPDEHGTS
jgi:hypothetical protein